MGVIKAAIGDALLTSMWVFSMPFLKIFTGKIATFLGVQTLPLAALFITTNLVSTMVFIFSLIGDAFGGASWNPTASLTFYAAGLKKDSSLLSMAVRFPAQAAGGVAGVKAILGVIPGEYRKTLKGPSLRVDLHTGFLAEGLLTFGLCLALLVILFKGPKNPLLKLWLMAASTVGLVRTGFKYTGPSLNPANAFGWAYVNNWHNSWELYYVYWIGPLIGATLAAWVFRFLLSPPPPTKEKKA
ncbi:aquaporin SIP1-1-like [Durio zibethinus]|uniref:Aquaporin SIP1-1-like n=1 Tax=Durio zibethinus TaxID=66656 RepID=A0A6P6AHV3_DURZI|nr:aquaporin SIP1-1-like [Durio zibethinus]